tara:strand:- start:235 stop:540 length:306 start_codon:yes stop_codon:yes gene_type:complete
MPRIIKKQNGDSTPTSKSGEPIMRHSQETLTGMKDLFGGINADIAEVNHRIAMQYSIKNRTGYPSEQSRQIQTDKWKHMLTTAQTRYPNVRFSAQGFIKPQ